jgi:alpha-beta hydrolase superfamily lysophospholipase
MVYKLRGRLFESADDYFTFISKEFGYPDEFHLFQQEQVITHDGLKLNLEVLRAGKDKPTVIFIPGTAVYALCNAGLLLGIHKAGYNVIGIDMRGHGRSEGLRGDYTILQLMSDTRKVIEYARQEFNDNISLLGCSQGGIVAFYLAAAEVPVQSIICQNFADLTAPETIAMTRYQHLTKVFMPLINRLGILMPHTMIPINSYLDLSKVKVRYFGNLQKFLEEDPLVLKSISLRALRSLASTHMRRPIEEITLPVMILTGDKDSIFPLSYQETLFAKIKSKKRLQVYKDCDHGLLSENVDLVLPDIIQWLNETYLIPS